MYVYNFIYIMTTVMKNRSDKEVIRAFTSLTKDFKIHGDQPRITFHGKRSINSIENGNDNHEYQLTAGSLK